MDFAVVEIGGKQYKVAAGQKLKTEKIDAETGANLSLDKVLLISSGDNVEIGTPYVEGAKINAKVLRQGKNDKIIVFKYHSKTRYRKKKGHRQPFTELEIIGINQNPA